MSLDMIFNECLSLNLYVCTYSQQFKLIGEGKTAKWEQDQCRHFEKYCKYQPHSAFLPLEPKILCFLPVVLCIFQKQLRPSSLTILPFIQFTGVNIGWRCGHLSREELRERIIWIDKSFSRGWIYCVSRTAPPLLRQCSKVCLSVSSSTPSVENDKVFTFKDAWSCFLRNSGAFYILFYFALPPLLCVRTNGEALRTSPARAFCCESRWTVIRNWSRKCESP